jgi:hypothetical protein
MKTACRTTRESPKNQTSLTLIGFSFFPACAVRADDARDFLITPIPYRVRKEHCNPSDYHSLLDYLKHIIYDN